VGEPNGTAPNSTHRSGSWTKRTRCPAGSMVHNHPLRGRDPPIARLANARALVERHSPALAPRSRANALGARGAQPRRARGEITKPALLSAFPFCDAGVFHSSSSRVRCRMLNRNQTGSIALWEWWEDTAPRTSVIYPSIALLLAVCSRADVGGTVRPWILKLERTRRWAADRAAIKAEVKRAQETVDLISIARAITRLDALEAEIEAVEKTEPANRN
jgi:hypothetical protein